MTSTPNPTWYDVLGVPGDASPEEIKAAWRNATDKFEPGSGSGQFRMFNDAADVLLDPARRAAYDETLAVEQPPVTLDKAPEEPALPVVEEPVVEEPVVEEPVEDPSDPELPEPQRHREPASRTAGIIVLVLALLTVAAVVAAAFFGLQVRRDARVADAREQAPAAAERAAKAMLSYDYRTLPADRKRAGAFLTDDFSEDYLENFEQLEKQKDGTPGLAVQSKTVVTSTVLGSGVMDAEDGVVRVLVYVNQVSKKPDVDPQIFQNRVAMTMEKDGNRWLVDDLKSY